MAVLFLALLGALLLGIFAASDAAADQKITVAFSAPEDTMAARLVENTFAAMQSVRSTLSITETDEATARRMVERGEAKAAILLPQQFVEHIMIGQNTPAVLVLGDAGSTEAILLAEAGSAAAEMLQVSQCGVYAVLGQIDSYAADPADRDAAMAEINLRYIRLAMARGGMITQETVSQTGVLSTFDYLCCAALTMYLTLMGLAMSGYCARPNAGFQKRLNACFPHGAALSVSRLVGLMLLMAILCVPAVTALHLIGFPVTLGLLAALLPAMFLCANLTMLCYLLGRTPLAGTMLLLIVSVVSTFIGGGLIPIALLPAAFSRIAPYLPTAGVIDAVRGAAVGQAGGVVSCLVWGVMLLMTSILLGRREGRRA